ncbi:MAG: multiheme c-type cytochrome [Pirellulaceae bacterium]
MSRHKQSRQSNRSRNNPQYVAMLRKVFPVIALIVVLVSALAAVVSDWFVAIPADRQAKFVGRTTCIECHQDQHADWEGSYHDKAMDLATDETVLGDFDDAEFTHFDIKSKMFRRDGKFWINTEGPTGTLQDFEVKYVFGVDPLQQYMVELEPPTPGSESGAIGRTQVLRISWDTQAGKWFYLPPPDVAEKLAPEDPLHWTGAAQNWNHMCADCHSTNLQKNHDLASNTFHTTFSEINVSCESCHGPGSIHVELANQKSLFWDRNHGYGLKKLKGADNVAQVESCGACHSRRQVVCSKQQLRDSYYDQFNNELIMPNVYHCDGQVLDENYVYGSFLQSKMFHKGIRCTDCHDPHSTKVKFEGNKLCTDCHTHPSGKFDTPGHHFHEVGSTGASCVECHMPETTYMEVDPRRDHSIRVPRPDLSVNLGTPNACTKCHLDRANISDEKRAKLPRYDQWIIAARNGDEEVQAALKEVDQWAAEAVTKWYGQDLGAHQDHFAYALSAAWEGDPESQILLDRLARNANSPGIVRASALVQLGQFATPEMVKTSLRLISDPDPQIRIAAIGNLDGAQYETGRVQDSLLARLDDDIRAVRIEAARVLVGTDPQVFALREKQAAFDNAYQELADSIMRNSDLASSHHSLGLLHERAGDLEAAEKAYRNAIRVQKNVTGPRANLAQILETKNRREEGQMRQLVLQRNRAAAEKMTPKLASRAVEIQRLRQEELENLARDVKLLPTSAPLQYRYGLALYLAAGGLRPEDRAEAYRQALAAIEEAVELEPGSPDYLMALALLGQKMERWEEADRAIDQLLEINPNAPGVREIAQQIKARQQPESQPPGGMPGRVSPTSRTPGHTP